jgi:hypothetical protein
MPRDDFPKFVIEALAKRVGLLCSNPDCGRLTAGPHTEPSKAVNVGVAAHITAASEGGPRYDPTLTVEDRKSAENGIWLCQNCGKLVDADADRYKVELLREWKTQAEMQSFREVTGQNWQQSEAEARRRGDSSLPYYLEALLADVTFLDSPVINAMTSLTKIPLRDVFVAVQAVSTAPRLKVDVLVREGLEKVLRGVRYSPTQPITISETAILDSLKNSWQATPPESPRVEVNHLIGHASALVILGPPGAGKSTLLRYIALTRCAELLSGPSADSPVPFLLRLATLSSFCRSTSFFEGIGSYVSNTYGEHAYHSLVAASQQGRALLLLDGLDEVGSITEKTQLVVKVQEFSRGFLGRGNRILVTSRLVGYRTHRPLSEPFEHFAVAELSTSAARGLIASLVQGLNEQMGRRLTSHDVHKAVGEVERTPGSESLLGSPLTATMLAARSVAQKPSPQSKTELYQQVADLLEGEWDFFTGREPAFSKKLLSHALSALARWMLDNRPSGLITYQEADDIIVQGLVTNHQATRIDAENMSRALLLHIRESSGILVEQAPGLLGFTHRSLLEFYAAANIVNNMRIWQKELRSYLFRSDCVEVCRFALGMASLRHVGVGEAFLSDLITEDRQIGSPLHRSLLRAFTCAAEIQNPSVELVTLLSAAIGDILFDIRVIPYVEGELVYRPTMFASFRSQMAEALTDLMRFCRHSEVVSNVILRHRSYSDTEQPGDEPGEAGVFVSHEEVPAVTHAVRTLNLLSFLSTSASATHDVMDALDHLLANGNDEAKRGVIACLLAMGLRRRESAIISRLEGLVRNDSLPFAYGNYRCDALTALCRLDHQTSWFLGLLEFYRLERTTFESYAVVAGLPYMSDTPAVRQLCEHAIASSNLAVPIEFVRAILVSNRAQQSTWLQECLIRSFKVSTFDELRWLTLTAISRLGWLSAEVNEFLKNVVFDRQEEGWVRHYAADCLRQLGTIKLTEMAGGALIDDDSAVRYAGVCFSASSGVLLEPFVEPLLRLAKEDPDDGVRGDAYKVLADHGYANNALTSDFIVSALSAAWDSRVRTNAIQFAARDNITKGLSERLRGIVDEAARFSLRDSVRGHELHPDGDLKDAYNAALILTQGGLTTDASEKILNAAIHHPSNRVRERVYQDFGIADLPSPVLLRLLIAAIEDENEVVLGKPSLYKTLDRIASISEEGLLALVEMCDKSSDDDVLGFCCSIIHRALEAPGFRVEPEIVRRCCVSVTRALRICVFDASNVGSSRSGKMYDDVFDALSFLAEIAGDMLQELNNNAAYPWRGGMPGHRSLRAERAFAAEDLRAFLQSAQDAGLQDLSGVLRELSITSEIGKADSRADPRACAERVLSLLSAEEVRYGALWTKTLQEGMQLREAYAFSDQQFVAVKYALILKGLRDLTNWLRGRIGGSFDYGTLIAFRGIVSAAAENTHAQGDWQA